MNSFLIDKTLTGSAALLVAPLALSLSLVSGAGCVGDDPPKDDMAMSTADLAASRRDLAAGADLSVASDLAVRPDMPPPVSDLAGSRVTGLPSCTVTGVTADTLFTDVVKPSCASVMCHATGASGLTFTSGATVKSALVGVAGKQIPIMPLVTAGSVDGSYVMYKLTGQHLGIGGRGDLMPKGGMRLPDADLCKFIVWIKEGAK